MPRNAGIRGLPPRFDLLRAIERVFDRADTRAGRPVLLSGELDEQGLQTAALSLEATPRVVSTDDVSICSPFHPHQPWLGRCGAHFVGINARHIPWNYFDRPADQWMAEHWERHRDAICHHVRVTPEVPRSRPLARAV